MLGLAGGASAEPAGSAVRSFQAGLLDVGVSHSCAVLQSAAAALLGLRQLGPARLRQSRRASATTSCRPRPARSISAPAGPPPRVAAGTEHTCAVLDNGSVRCWGANGFGQLGYGNTAFDRRQRGAGQCRPGRPRPGRTARAVSAGEYSCALFDDGSVRCWGSDFSGQLGYGAPVNVVGDNETPGSQPPLNLATKRHGAVGRPQPRLRHPRHRRRALLGPRRQTAASATATSTDIGDDEDPRDDGPVNLGPGRTARAIAAGARTPARSWTTATVRCWGSGAYGKLGYGNLDSIGDNEPPGSARAGQPRRRQDRGRDHAPATCTRARSSTTARCAAGVLAPTASSATATPPRSATTRRPGGVFPVDLGRGQDCTRDLSRRQHTCALLDDGSVRCWGAAGNGQLGYGNADTIGDNEAPGFGRSGQSGRPSLWRRRRSVPGPVRGSQSSRGGPAAHAHADAPDSGLDGAAGVNVAVRLPVGLELLSVHPSQGTHDPALGNWNVGSLASGAAATLTVVARAAAAGTVHKLG